MSSPREGSPYQQYVYSYPHKTAHRPLDPPRPLAEVWAPERKDGLFLYLHVPFCEMRCGFCNLFTTTGARRADLDRYLAQLEVQARVVADAVGPASFARLAVGGGTPTLLAPDQLERLLGVARRLGARGVPASVETSPKTAHPERLSALKEFGVRRVSMGVQSFDEADTRALGRSQRRAEVERAIRSLRDAGFEVVNLDLMYGAAGQTEARWLASVRAALAHRPEELFLYPLYVRRLTALGEAMRREATDRRLALYRAARALLLDEGYAQVSMRLFRRADVDAGGGPAYRCQEDGMVGLGCGARSYTDRLHYSWPWAVGRGAIREILAAYAARDAASFGCADHGVALDRDDRVRRYVILSILHRDGLDLARYAARFGRDPRLDLPRLGRLLDDGLLVDRAGRLAPTAAGLERSDAIGPWLASSRVEGLMRSYAWR